MPESASSRLWFPGLALACASLVACVASGEEASQAKPEPPRIAMFLPLAVPTDATTKVTARGWNLEGVKELTSAEGRIQLKLLTSAKATVPNGLDAKHVGDTQVEFEITVPKDVAPVDVTIVVSGEGGKSEPRGLAIGSRHPRAEEKEWNDGFRQAQKLEFPQTVDGLIHENRNVDVFSFELSVPQRVGMDVLASRRGSSLDSLLTLFDERGTMLAVNDDHDGSSDSKIAIDLSAGRYFISLQDANDRGSIAHPYRLIVQSEDASMPTTGLTIP